MTISRRTLTILLVVAGVSLSANFAAMGFLAAQRYFHHGPPDMMRMVQLGLGGLPDPLRERVADELDADRPNLREHLRALREGRRELIEAMRAEPFDRQRVEAAFETLGGQLEAMRRRGEAAVVRALEQATPEERAQIREPRGRVPELEPGPPPPGTERRYGVAAAIRSARWCSTSRRLAASEAAITPSVTMPIRMVQIALISGVTPRRTWL